MADKLPDCIAFGKAVRRLRAAQGFSQEAFANKAGLHRTYMGGLERGERNPTLITICRIARELGMSLAELFQEVHEDA